MARYTLLLGSYTGTSDDVAGRWYIHDAEAAILDKRGAGYASRTDAYETLLQRLSGTPIDRGPDLVSITGIARATGHPQATVYAWIRRNVGFPEPLIDFGPAYRRWDWDDVRDWRAVQRPNGRPRKG